MQQDAVFSALAQDDFQQSTDFRGHVYGVKYKISPRLSVRGWGLTSQTERGHAAGRVDDDDGTKLRIDLDVRF